MKILKIYLYKIDLNNVIFYLLFIITYTFPFIIIKYEIFDMHYNKNFIL